MWKNIVLFFIFSVLFILVPGRNSNDVNNEVYTPDVQIPIAPEPVLPCKNKSTGTLPIMAELINTNKVSGSGSIKCLESKDQFLKLNFSITPINTWGLPYDFCNGSKNYTYLKYCTNNGQWNENLFENLTCETIVKTDPRTIACTPTEIVNIESEDFKNLSALQIYLTSIALIPSLCHGSCLPLIDRLLGNKQTDIQEALNSWEVIMKALETNLVEYRGQPWNQTHVTVTYSELTKNKTMSLQDVEIRRDKGNYTYSNFTLEVRLSKNLSNQSVHCSVITFPKMSNLTVVPIFGFFCNPFNYNPGVYIAFEGLVNSIPFKCFYWKKINAKTALKQWVLDYLVFVFNDEKYKCATIPTWRLLKDIEYNHRKKYCPPNVQDADLSFLPTRAGYSAIPLEQCLQCDYRPVVRKCFLNGTWGPIQGKCCKGMKMSETTSMLEECLRGEDMKTADQGRILAQLPPYNFRSIDVHLTAKILERLSTNAEGTNQKNFFQAANNVMAINRTVMIEAQKILNATDHILCSIDTFLYQKNPVNLFLSNLSVTTMDVTTDAVGIMIYDKIITTLGKNYSAILLKSDFDAALVVTNIKRYQKFKLVAFDNDNFFNCKEIQNQSSVNSFVLGVLNTTDFVQNNTRVQVFFKQFIVDANPSCSYWKYGNDDADQPTYGRWIRESKPIHLKEDYYYCEFQHLTHFGLLLSDSFGDNLFLDVITIFGSVMSIIGIAVIFATAVTFKKWRNNPSNIVVLNIAVCLLLVIILFFSSDFIPRGPYCIAAGILLHYLLLAQFFWMLAICFSNYRKLVVVFNIYIDHIISKYCLFCWGCPLLIVIATASFSLETYDKDEIIPQLCYPKDIYLQLGFVLPAAIILTINLIAYISIIKNIKKTFNVATNTLTKSYSTHKFLLLMFFMMGFTWIFGILAAITTIDFFLYMFCVTSTFQGFVMFVFFILESSETAEMWKNKIAEASKAPRSASS